MNQEKIHSTETLYIERQSRLAEFLNKSKLDALALNPGPSLTYLTGMHFHLMERPVVAIFTAQNPPVIVLPDLEAGKAAGQPYPIQVFPYGEDPSVWIAAFRQAAQAAGIDGRRVGVEPTRLRYLELNFLQAAAESAQYISAEETLAELRMRKDPQELAFMRRAVDIAQQALRATLPSIRAGVTEKEIASELTYQLLRAGSEPEFPFTPIVSAGPNGANPHAMPGLRPLQSGDLLVIDWGAAHQSYFSDLTRTFAIGQPDPEWVRIHDTVRMANQAGLEAVRPGVTAGAVDQAARHVIEQAGYGQYFIHRTGHGLGMESHEAPYIRQGNTLLLEPGMTFTVEPGIYIAGRNGVRIEDNVVVTEQGSECLSDFPRELIYLDQG